MLIVLVVLFIIYALPSFASTELSLTAAERLFLERNLELKAKKTDIERAEAEVITAGLLPNPSFRYHVESVKNGARDTEQFYTLNQSLDIVPKRELRREAAARRKEAARLFFEGEAAGALLQLRESYCRLILLRENATAVSETMDVLADIEAKASERVRAGDTAESDLMKLNAERRKLQREFEALRLESRAEKTRLALMLDLGTDEFEVSGPTVPLPATVDLRRMTEAALEKRPDLTARAARVAAAETSLNLSKRESVAPLEIEAGYKSQTGGFEGYVFGITVPIPLFDRNQGKIRAAAAELESERLTYEVLRRGAMREVRLLSERLAFLSDRATGLSEQLKSSRELSKIARVLYDEGETGLLDLFDSFRSEKEVLRDYHAALYEYRVALFELEKATGTNLRDAGGVQ